MLRYLRYLLNLIMIPLMEVDRDEIGELSGSMVNAVCLIFIYY